MNWHVKILELQYWKGAPTVDDCSGNDRCDRKGVRVYLMWGGYTSNLHSLDYFQQNHACIFLQARSTLLSWWGITPTDLDLGRWNYGK